MVRVRVRVSVNHNPTLTLKQHSFIKKDTPRFRSRSRPRVLLTPVPAGAQGWNPGSLNYGGG